MISQLLPVEHLTDELPSAALAGRAASRAREQDGHPGDDDDGARQVTGGSHGLHSLARG